MDPKSPGYETGLNGYCIIKKILIRNPCMLLHHGGPGAIVYHPSPTYRDWETVSSHDVSQSRYTATQEIPPPSTVL